MSKAKHDYRPRTWTPTNQDTPTAPWIYVVHRPITFGHSQLWLEDYDPAQIDEATLFRDLVSPVVAKAIHVFSSALPELLDDFPELAEATSTRGNYKKTLVLRASANEDEAEYKVHLVPYFESHHELCTARYRNVHGKLDHKATGGLLGWLGERETGVDRSEGLANEQPLQFLAERLKECWPPA